MEHQDPMEMKHAEFEGVTAGVGIHMRTIENNAHGIAQHVVHLKNGGLLRWPVSYEQGAKAWRASVAAAAEAKKMVAAASHELE